MFEFGSVTSFFYFDWKDDDTLEAKTTFPYINYIIRIRNESEKYVKLKN